MCNRSLRDCWEKLGIREGTEIVHELLHVFGRGWNEGRPTGVEGATSNPVLFVSNSASVSRQTGSSKKLAMNFQNPANGNGLGRSKDVDGPLHRLDVPEDLLGCDIPCGDPRFSRSFRS
jgi:hypothetical protein